MAAGEGEFRDGHGGIGLTEFPRFRQGTKNYSTTAEGRFLLELEVEGGFKMESRIKGPIWVNICTPERPKRALSWMGIRMMLAL